MMGEQQCLAITRQNDRCRNRAKYAGFCQLHVPLSDRKRVLASTETLTGRAKKVAELLVVANAGIDIVKNLLELWDALPWGSPGENKSPEYIKLRQAFPKDIWPDIPSKIVPFNRTNDSIYWKELYEIYQISICATEHAGQVELEKEEMNPSKLNDKIASFLKNMPAEFQEMFYDYIGNKSEPQN